MISIQYSGNSFAAKRVPETPVLTAEVSKLTSLPIDSDITDEKIESYMSLLMRRFDMEKTPNIPSSNAKSVTIWLKSKSNKLYIMASDGVEGRLEKVMDSLSNAIHRALDYFPGDIMSIINALYQTNGPKCIGEVSGDGPACGHCISEYLPLLEMITKKSSIRAIEIATKIHKQQHTNPDKSVKYGSLYFEQRILEKILETFCIVYDMDDIRASMIMPLFNAVKNKIEVAAIVEQYRSITITEKREELIRRIRHLLVKENLA